MKGKLVVVTGGTGGLGKEAACELGKLGARLILIGRDPTRGQAAVEEVKRRAGHGDVELRLADLSSIEASKKLAQELRGVGRIDVLLNNAGALFMHRYETVDKLEMSFGLNHLSYFILANLLHDVVEGRIVNVSSGAHARGRLELADAQWQTRRYRGLQAYCDTKLMNVMFTYEMARRLDPKRTTVNALHPGAVATTWGRTDPGWFKLGATIARPFLLSVQKGALTPIYLCSSPEVEGTTGKYFFKRKEANTIRRSYDETVQRELWEYSEELTGVKGPPRIA
jgi:NAD(P)-dependent dehydrogenase (short-subunit alcohol dehydrogenase family)